MVAAQARMMAAQVRLTWGHVNRGRGASANEGSAGAIDMGAIDHVGSTSSFTPREW